MIFRRPLLGKVLAGQKTQTRRPVKGELRSPYNVGRSYAVQPGRGKTSVARIRVVEVRRERLGAITPREAQLEGFKRRDQFIDYWRELYGKVDEEQLVWVISFVLEPEIPRFLAPSRDPHDYTTNPNRALDDAEVPPPGWRDPGVEHARARHTEARGDEARRFNARSIGSRVREVALAAERAGVDISHQLAEIERQVEQIEQLHRTAA